MISSLHPWEPVHVSFRINCRTFEEEITAVRGISTIEKRSKNPHLRDIGVMNHRIINSIRSRVRNVCSVSTMTSGSIQKEENIGKSSLDFGTTELPYPDIFQSLSWYTNILA